jgi:hypothetical protein
MENNFIWERWNIYKIVSGPVIQVPEKYAFKKNCKPNWDIASKLHLKWYKAYIL